MGALGEPIEPGAGAAPGPGLRPGGLERIPIMASAEPRRCPGEVPGDVVGEPGGGLDPRAGAADSAGAPEDRGASERRATSDSSCEHAAHVDPPSGL